MYCVRVNRAPLPFSSPSHAVCAQTSRQLHRRAISIRVDTPTAALLFLIRVRLPPVSDESYNDVMKFSSSENVGESINSSRDTGAASYATITVASNVWRYVLKLPAHRIIESRRTIFHCGGITILIRKHKDVVFRETYSRVVPSVRRLYHGEGRGMRDGQKCSEENMLNVRWRLALNGTINNRNPEGVNQNYQFDVIVQNN